MVHVKNKFHLQCRILIQDQARVPLLTYSFFFSVRQDKIFTGCSTLEGSISLDLFKRKDETTSSILDKRVAVLVCNMRLRPLGKPEMGLLRKNGYLNQKFPFSSGLVKYSPTIYTFFWKLKVLLKPPNVQK